MTNKEKALALINTFATGDTEKAKDLLAALTHPSMISGEQRMAR